MSNKSNFAFYSYKEEMIGDAIEAVVKYIHNYNPEKTQNAFAYVSQIVYNAFVNRLNEEQKHHYVKAKIARNSGALVSDENFSADSFNAVIESFENKQARRKEKTTSRKTSKI